MEEEEPAINDGIEAPGNNGQACEPNELARADGDNRQTGMPRRFGWWWRRGDGHEDDSDDEEGGAYDGNSTGEQALVVLVVSSVAASASTSAAVSGSVPVGLAAKNLKLMHEGAQDLNLAFPQHHGHAL
uniref:Uncharacterized protein n=1 Tax=Oryza nivara TaxID=4536 RepID=A0A0E0GVS2_ORYNI